MSSYLAYAWENIWWFAAGWCAVAIAVATPLGLGMWCMGTRLDDIVDEELRNGPPGGSGPGLSLVTPENGHNFISRVL